MTEPNDILIRITKNDDGSYSRDIAIAINDDSMMPEMQRTADFIGKCLEVFGSTEAELEYHNAITFANKLAKPTTRIKLLN